MGWLLNTTLILALLAGLGHTLDVGVVSKLLRKGLGAKWITPQRIVGIGTSILSAWYLWKIFS